MSPSLPDAVPCPDKPPLHLKGGYLCVTAPERLDEACFSVPAIRALKNGRPQGTLTVLCPEGQSPLWRGMSQVDDVISYQGKSSARQIARQLVEVKTPFDSAIVWQPGNAAKAVARAGIQQRLGYPARGMGKLLTDQVEVVLEPGPAQHRVRHYMNLVEKLGVMAYAKENFESESLGAPPGKPRVVLAPTSTFGETHQWPVEGFAAVIEELDQRHGEIDWVILNDAGEKHCQQVCEQLETLSNGRARIENVTDVGDVLGVLASSSALLASDSYTAHLAAHIGLPSAVVFGPNEPEWKRPLGKQNQIVREHVACSPCYLARCPLDLRCQERVGTDEVAAALEKALAVRYAGCLAEH